MKKDNVKVVCEYLTGRITKEDFTSEYKKQVTDSFEDSYSDKKHLAGVVQDVLDDGGVNLQNSARENDFDAKMRLDLRIVENIRFEYIKGMKILCIPELYGLDEDIYRQFLFFSGLYDMCFMHGTIKGAIYGFFNFCSYCRNTFRIYVLWD